MDYRYVHVGCVHTTDMQMSVLRGLLQAVHVGLMGPEIWIRAVTWSRAGVETSSYRE